MPKLARFSTPARLDDPDPKWSKSVSALFQPFLVARLPQFYDPTKKSTPANAREPMVSWAAFPASLRTGTKVERWRRADADRNLQDEYCEWTVERNRARKIKRITFTTELPEYWEHLFDNDPGRLLELYRELVDPRVKLKDLTAGGGYRRRSQWNSSNPGRLAHLSQQSNNLFAAIALVAEATVPRVAGGQIVTDQQQLAGCAGLGEPLRNSDPQIASAVNVAARQGNEITLANPPGLHLGRPLTAGMRTPDDADAADFWKIERGDAEHTLRARFEVPASRRYVVGDIKAGGRSIEFGGQVAERVPIWIKVAVKPGNHKPKPTPCG